MARMLLFFFLVAWITFIGKLSLKLSIFFYLPITYYTCLNEKCYSFYRRIKIYIVTGQEDQCSNNLPAVCFTCSCPRRVSCKVTLCPRRVSCKLKLCPGRVRCKVSLCPHRVRCKLKLCPHM